MRDQELIGLYEAYQQVHGLQEAAPLQTGDETGTGPRLQDPYNGKRYDGGGYGPGGRSIKGPKKRKNILKIEEVEIASHYFCEMGLNEIGVEILIEELGVEEFSEFVYDISEEYYLTEARAAKKRTGGESYADVKAKIDAKEAAKKKAKEGAALQRQDAMVSASNQQPKRKGLLDRVAGVVLQGIARHKAATDGMGAATKETASKIGKAAREFGTGLMSSYDNWVGQLISDGYDLSNWTDEGLFEYYEQLCEESLEIGQSPTPGGKTKKTPVIPPLPPKGTKVNTGYKESYEIVFDYLISEGYADTNEAALAIMASMSEDWKYSIVEAAADQSDKQIEKGVKTTYQAGNVLDNTHQGRSPGLNKLPRGERTAKKERMRKRLETRRDDLFGERRNREDERRS
jgi:hypothetical protein